MAEIKQKRMSSDSVELWSDEQQYLLVSRVACEQWSVERKNRDVFFPNTEALGKFATAAEAIRYAKEWLEKGAAELDKALEGL